MSLTDKIKQTMRKGIPIVLGSAMLFNTACSKFNPLESYLNETGKATIVQTSGTAFDNDGEREITQRLTYDDREGAPHNAIVRYGIDGNPQTNTVPATISGKNITYTITPTTKGTINGTVDITDNLGNPESVSFSSRVYKGEIEGDAAVQAWIDANTHPGTSNADEIDSRNYNQTIGGKTYDFGIITGDIRTCIGIYQTQKEEVTNIEQYKSVATSNFYDFIVIRPGQDIGMRINDYLINNHKDN